MPGRGGWLAAAIAAGPLMKPLPAIAGIATVILSVPWWFHRRRRAKARIEKTISAWPDVAENAGLAGSEILSVVVDAWGWTARVLLRKGKTTGEVIGKILVLESNLGLRLFWPRKYVSVSILNCREKIEDTCVNVFRRLINPGAELHILIRPFIEFVVYLAEQDVNDLLSKRLISCDARKISS